jgi:hypothetical protein
MFQRVHGRTVNLGRHLRGVSPREALAKAAEFLDEGHSELIFKDLLGNVLDRAVVVTMAEIED